MSLVSVCLLTSGFMEAQGDMSIKAETEVVVEDINGKLKKHRSYEHKLKFLTPLCLRLLTHFVCLMFIHVLRSCLRVWLHIQIPSVQLDDVSILNVREDLCYRFIGVTLREDRLISNIHKSNTGIYTMLLLVLWF